MSLEIPQLVVLAALLVWVCVTDVRTRRIPNTLIVAIALAGITRALVSPSSSVELAKPILGMATGLLPWLALYGSRMVSAGDVKLFMACGAWLGPTGTIEATVFTAIAGGLFAIILMSIENGIGTTVSRLTIAVRHPAVLRSRQATSYNRIPYGIAISIGVLTAAVFPGLIV